MLVIKIRDEVITFNPVGEWVSSDKALAATLNAMIPEGLWESCYSIFRRWK